ncbi:MAG TPA: heterodisulfide reductase-related iron-sulfur binding cluster [Acidimicrobiales bacterium]|nr:heterodisulfide reductase-related iron-sulfur binding cluster [Acidimicrobiales bacterium]
MGAFDAHRPPAKELVDVCVHCGFCLPTCPTYVLWNEEMDSPRGRIVLMNVALEEADRLSDSMVTHWDRCLGCMACVTACPSGVRYDKLIEATRPQVERNHERSPRDRAFRRFAFETFTHPGRLRAMVPLMAAAQRVGLTRAVNGSLKRFPRIHALQSLLPDVPVKAAAARLPETIPARGKRRGRVGMLLGCVQRVFFDDVNQATARVLAAEGFDVFAPRSVRCCGALMLHSGAETEALGLARKMIEAFEGCDYVAVNAAGCGSSMKDYGDLLSDDEEWAERAKRFSEKVRDVSELLAECEPVTTHHPVPLKVVYHDACHLAHAQKVRSEPRQLLGGIPELELVEPAEWEICCGSAGIYNLLQPDAGRALGQRKAENLLATGAEAIASGNPGCTLQIAAHLRDKGRPLPIYHPIQLLDRSIRGDSHGVRATQARRP